MRLEINSAEWLSLLLKSQYLTHWGQVKHICITKTRPWLVQKMTCCLVCAEPLSELVLVYGQLDTTVHITVKFDWIWIKIQQFSLLESKYNNFHWRKRTSRCHLQTGGRFCLGLNVLINAGHINELTSAVSNEDQVSQVKITPRLFLRTMWNKQWVCADHVQCVITRCQPLCSSINAL